MGCTSQAANMHLNVGLHRQQAACHPQQHRGCMRILFLCLVMPSTGGPHSLLLCVYVHACVCLACEHPAMTLAHSAWHKPENSCRKCSSFVPPSDSHQDEKLAAHLHLIYLSPLQQTWITLLTLDSVHMDERQIGWNRESNQTFTHFNHNPWERLLQTGNGRCFLSNKTHRLLVFGSLKATSFI